MADLYDSFDWEFQIAMENLSSCRGASDARIWYRVSDIIRYEYDTTIRNFLKIENTIHLGYVLKKLKSVIYLLNINKNKMEIANNYDPKIWKD